MSIAEDIDDSVPDEAQPVPPEQFVAYVIGAQNIAEDLPEQKLAEIAQQCIDDYQLDKASMSSWFDQMKRGLELAKLVKSEKTYPHKKASNVKYPLVTSAALQFNARAYPAIVPADQAVKAQTFGADPQGLKAARAERIATHMSWQLQARIEEWEEDTDSLLVQLPIVGEMFRKVWYDPVEERPRCRLIEAGKLIVNDKAKNLASAPRCTEELALYPSEIRTRVISGDFLSFDYEDQADDKLGAQEFLEQHTRIDLDEDGYAEPYIVTVHKDTETVVRIVADFDEEDVRFTREQQVMDALAIDPMTQMQVMVPQQVEVVTGIASIKRGSYFIAYKFMPGLDGGLHGTGLGLLLGDISDSINTILNMLLDAGHMASMGGGFIGSEFRIKGGNSRFEPGEWKLGSATGGVIKDSVVPMTFPGPDAVLFQMLGMLIEAGKEVSSTKDIMSGDSGGKVQTATTTLALIEQGMMVFTASYKRIFRSLKKEYKILAKMNATTVSAEEYNAFFDDVDGEGQPVQHDPAADYSAADMDISPTADPRSVTKMQEAAKAQIVMQLAEAGMVDKAEGAKRVLEAASIPNLEELTPEPDPMMAQMAQFEAQMTMEMAKADLSQKMVDIDMTLAKIESEKANVMKTMVDAEAQRESLRLDAMTMILEDRRNAIEQTLKLGLSGLEGQPRNSSGPASTGGNFATPTATGPAGLLGGQGMA